MLVSLTRCMRFWDDFSVAQLLVRRMGHLRKGRPAEQSVLACNSKHEDCAKHVRVQAGLPASGEVTTVGHSNLKIYQTDYRERCWKTIPCTVDPVECY